MKKELIDWLKQSNPWLDNPHQPVLDVSLLIEREQLPRLLLEEWDRFWTILVGPRQAGKTTLGLLICQHLLAKKRFHSLLYLNCDELLIREWLKTPLFIQQSCDIFGLKKPIFFIDEVQRLTNPGLLLKSIIDLKLPIKLIASGSSQLELKSKVQEFLTGRHIEALILPLSYTEITNPSATELMYGCFPNVLRTKEKAIILQQLYQNYIQKDIVEFLKIQNPDAIQKLISLIAHSSGQLVNYQQLATDIHVSAPTIKHYLALLEQTYTLARVTPFVGNKRKEITSNPVYYFIDNGFRNQALRNFTALSSRNDRGLLVESAVFQELLKLRARRFFDFDIHFWRTQSGAEIDFILYVNAEKIIPIEVKYRNMSTAKLTRSFHSFLEAYQPKNAFFITKNLYEVLHVDGCVIEFIPLEMLAKLFDRLNFLLTHSE
jgi:uncharacterized protein